MHTAFATGQLRVSTSTIAATMTTLTPLAGAALLLRFGLRAC